MIEASAPGRVNLIGEHTDYNGGFVLPMAIPQRTRVTLRPREGRRVRLESAGMARAEFTLGDERRTGEWSDYVKGVTWVLARAGFSPGGMDVQIRSDVPVGGGLSSSAALCVALLRAMREAWSLALPDLELALLAQKVETGFVGAPVGVMDQMASSLADDRTALFIDTRSLAYQRTPLPPEAAILVINSGIRHSNATGDYRTRRAECEEAARRLGVPQLRDLGDADLPALERLPDLLRRRARHVVTENARVLAAVRALEARDLQALGRLFTESHASMRDDFDVSLPEIDRLVEIAAGVSGVFGARLTGGGFGGCIVVLAHIRAATQAAESIIGEARRSRLGASLLVPISRS